MRQRFFKPSLLVFVGLMFGASSVSARDWYVPRIPAANGACDTCHSQVYGGPGWNAFGIAFENSRMRWTVDLCNEDSDGDGFTNGEELGMPCCIQDEFGDFELANGDIWASGDLGGLPPDQTSPGDPESTPTPDARCRDNEGNPDPLGGSNAGGDTDSNGGLEADTGGGENQDGGHGDPQAEMSGGGEGGSGGGEPDAGERHGGHLDDGASPIDIAGQSATGDQVQLENLGGSEATENEAAAPAPSARANSSSGGCAMQSGSMGSPQTSFLGFLLGLMVIRLRRRAQS